MSKRSRGNDQPTGARLIQDYRILELIEQEKLVIDPFEPEQITRLDKGEGEEDIISFGLSSFGYDLRLANKLKIFWRKYDPLQQLYQARGMMRPQHIDPKNPQDDIYFDVQYDFGEPIIIPPNSYALGCSVEYISIPPNMTFSFNAKATYALSGLFISTTCADAGWSGHFPIQLANLTPLPIIVYAEEGIGQARFYESDRDCQKPYEGRYQNQPSRPTLPTAMNEDRRA